MFGKYFGILLAKGLCAEGITPVLVQHGEGIGSGEEARSVEQQQCEHKRAAQQPGAGSP